MMVMILILMTGLNNTRDSGKMGNGDLEKSQET